jgi:hypothetical protein
MAKAEQARMILMNGADPIPERRPGGVPPADYPFDMLEVGHSMTVLNRHFQTVRHAMKKYMASHPGEDFLLRPWKADGYSGAKIWRRK